jgi:hypothetical protein
MSERDLPELPSDEELGIAGMDLDELQKLLEDEVAAKEGRKPPPPPPRRAPGAGTGEGSGPGRGSWGVGILTLLVLLVGTWASSENRALPDTVPANVPDTVFSSGRAMAQLVEMARAPRPLGSPEHTRVREMILDRLESLGLEPQVHTTVSLRRSGPAARAVTVRNILARIPGTASTGAVVLPAHYDAVPLSAGAGDDGTGVVAILETIRALLAGPPLENDVIVLITDGEELGLLGARAFVEEHPWMDDVAVVLSVEMRGGGGPVHMFETGADNGWIVQAMRASDPRPLATSLSVEIYRRMPNDTDFTPFREAGIQGLNFAGIGRAWVYHQPTDVPMNIQEETLQHHGMRVLAITRELGGRDLSQVDAPDLIYTTLPLLGVVAYPEQWALPISGGILLLWIVVLTVAAVRGARWTGALAGMGMVLAAGLGAWALGLGLISWLPRFHPEYGGMTPAFHGEGWYVLALVGGGVALMATLLGALRGRFSLTALGAGAVFLPVAGAVALAMVAPLAAFELQIASLAGVLAVGVVALPTVWLLRLDDPVAELERLMEAWGPLAALLSIGLMVLHSFVPFPAEMLAIANGPEPRAMPRRPVAARHRRRRSPSGTAARGRDPGGGAGWGRGSARRSPAAPHTRSRPGRSRSAPPGRGRWCRSPPARRKGRARCRRRSRRRYRARPAAAGTPPPPPRSSRHRTSPAPSSFALRIWMGPARRPHGLPAPMARA